MRIYYVITVRISLCYCSAYKIKIDYAYMISKPGIFFLIMRLNKKFEQ